MQEHPNTSGSEDETQGETPETSLEGSEQSKEVTSPDHPENLPSSPAAEPAPEPTPEAETPEVPSTEAPEPETEVAAESPNPDPPAPEPETSEVVETPEAETPEAETPEAEAPASEPSEAEATETPAEPETEKAAESPVVEAGEVTEPSEATPSAENAEAPADPAPSPEVIEEPEEEGPPSPAQELLAELLKEEESFERVVESSTTHECILLIEAFTQRKDLIELLAKVSLIRRRFDALEKAEDAEIPASVLSRYNMALAKLNRKRAEASARFEQSKEENSRLKYELLDRLKKIVEDELVDVIDEVREIQASWKDVGWVLQKDIQNLSRTYSTYLDYFYNLRGQYNALRDLDRQHNMAEKEKVMKEVESLIPAEDGLSRESWREYSEKVRLFQEHFRTIGPVPREKKDELMVKYRETLDRFYAARQKYYDVQDEQKKSNIALKQAIIDSLQPFSEFNSNKAKDWNQATKEVLQLQEGWKKIGPAPQEINRELWKLYRKTCDSFFETKSKFFKEFDLVRAENLKKKIALCEQAEGLMETENWKDTAQKLKDLQSEWKTIGPVHDRYSNKVWKRFRKACDHFFNRRDEAGDSRHSDYSKNQEAKEGLIATLTTILASDDPESSIDSFKEIQEKWKKTGHVPIKEKDRINNSFRDLAAAYYEKLKKVTGSNRFIKLDLISDPQVRARRTDSEVHKIRKKIRASKEKIESYETNILYIAKGRSGDSLRKMIQTQIDEEKVRYAKLNQQEEDIKNKKDRKPAPPKAAPQNLDDGQPLVEVADAPAPEAPAEVAEPVVAEAPAVEAPAEVAEPEAVEAPVVEAPAEVAEPEVAEAPAAEAPAEVAEPVAETPAAEVTPEPAVEEATPKAEEEE